MSKDENEPGDVVCVVVALGAAAFHATRELDRTQAGRYWRLIAAGAGAAAARADRTLVPDPEDDPTEWRRQLAERLSDEWSDDVAVCLVVVDGEDASACAAAATVLSAARCVHRASAAIVLGSNVSSDDAVRNAADLVLRADFTAADEGQQAVHDAIRGLLVPYESCFAHTGVDALVPQMRDLARGRLLTARGRIDDLKEMLISLVGAGALHRVRSVHVTMGTSASLRAMRFVDVVDGHVACEITGAAAIDESLGAEDAVLTVVVANPRASSSLPATQLRALVEDCACRRLPRDDRARLYGARLRHELDWWTADEQLSTALLELVARASQLRESGFIVGPRLRRPGGSLVAYVLGLSAFDPIVWDLSFAAFTGGRPWHVLELAASSAAMEQRALPTFPDLLNAPATRAWAFYCDPALDALEKAVRLRPFRWSVSACEDHRAFSAFIAADHVPYERPFLTARVEVLRRMAPCSLEELAAATVLVLRDGDQLLDSWAGSTSPLASKDSEVLPWTAELTERTRSCLLYSEQVDAALARTLWIPLFEATRIRRGLMKLSAPEWRARMNELGARCFAPEALAKVTERLAERACDNSRSEALGEALTWLSLTRAQLGTERHDVEVLRAGS